MPLEEKYNRYRALPDGTYETKHQVLNHCWRLWHACVITWDGVVVPCCFDKDASHPMGDLKQLTFKDIWQGTAYQKFRTQLLGGRQNIDICTNCTEGCKVWVKPD